MNWPHDNTKDLCAFYGDPRGSNGMANQRWALMSLTRVPVPWRMVPSWDPKKQVSSVQIHKKCADALDRVFRHLWEECQHDQRKIEAAGLHLFGGTYNFRVKRGLSSLSVHAFGAAIDLDPERNGLGDATPYMPRFVVEAFEAEGAVWGGNFRRKDGMHFQFAQI